MLFLKSLIKETLTILHLNETLYLSGVHLTFLEVKFKEGNAI